MDKTQHLVFYDFLDDPRRISHADAAALLGVSRRTLQNYAHHPEKRDAARWHLLELYTTGRILPADWRAMIRRVWDPKAQDNTDHLFFTRAGVELPLYQLEQSAMFASTSEAIIEQQRERIADLEAHAAALEARLATLQAQPATAPDNVIPFPSARHR